MTLEKLISATARGAAVSTQEVLPGGVLPLPNMPMRLSKPQYERASQLLFESTMRQLADNPTEVLLRDHLRPFEEKGAAFEARVAKGRALSAMVQAEADHDARLKRLHDQQQNRTFMEAFEQVLLVVSDPWRE
jgi:hypothetical protein